RRRHVHGDVLQRGSRFAVRRSPFAVRRSPFAVRRSPFAVRRSAFGVRREPLHRYSAIPLFRCPRTPAQHSSSTAAPTCNRTRRTPRTRKKAPDAKAAGANGTTTT
ncbi:hypothetical protein QZM01_23640, partial [Burkholderia multivorans]|nr:hypothetical protein [Burkholderia multivorans]